MNRHLHGIAFCLLCLICSLGKITFRKSSFFILPLKQLLSILVQNLQARATLHGQHINSFNLDTVNSWQNRTYKNIEILVSAQYKTFIQVSIICTAGKWTTYSALIPYSLTQGCSTYVSRPKNGSNELLVWVSLTFIGQVGQIVTFWVACPNWARQWVN